MRLIALALHLWMRLLGFRRTRRRLGEWSVVFYRKGRGGDPWILLHGLGSNALSWSGVARPLAPRHRMLIPELSSIGGTRGPRAALVVDDGARVIAELLRRELAGEPATVVAISLGAWTAVRLALAEPALVRRLVLINAGGYRDQDWDAIRDLVTVRDEAGVDRIYRALFHRVPLVFRFTRSTFLRVFQSRAVTSVVDTLQERDAFTAEDLARLRMPVGMVWAEGDGLFLPAVGREMARHVPGAVFTLVPDIGHAAHWEDPRRLLAAIRATVAAMDAAAATRGSSPESAPATGWPA